MSNYLSEIAKNIEPYVPGEQPKDKKYIKLNTNENPYGPSQKALDAMKKAVNEDLRLYPDPSSDELINVLADYYEVEKEQVFVGNGSDEILAFCFPTFFTGKKIFFPDISYSFYPVYANLFGVQIVNIPLKDDFSIDVTEYNNVDGGIVIPNPNAPTGKALSLEEIEKLLITNKKNLVIIDEAYVDFGAESATQLVDKYNNLLVVHTLSKSRSLAGLRVGIAIGNKKLIDGLNRIKNSFNSYTMDRIAQAGAIESIKDEEYFTVCNEKIIKTRNESVLKLKSLGFNIVDSKANFIFISHRTILAEELFQELKNDGILVRYFNKPRINNHLRVTIGTDEEMKTFIEKISTIINLNIVKRV